MSNCHVKSISPNGRRASVVFHIPIPIEDNNAGVDLRVALSQHIDGSNFVSAVPWLTTELSKIQSGELYEHSETVAFLAADNNAQKQAKIDARYTALTITILAKARATLMFWGLNRDVV
jgi:hypothetical protein